MAHVQMLSILLLAALLPLGVSGAVESCQGKGLQQCSAAAGGSVGEAWASEVLAGPRKVSAHEGREDPLNSNDEKDKLSAQDVLFGGSALTLVPGAAIVLLLTRAFGQQLRRFPGPGGILVNGPPQTFAAPKALEGFSKAAGATVMGHTLSVDSNYSEPEPSISLTCSKGRDQRRLSGASTTASNTSCETSPDRVSAFGPPSLSEEDEQENWELQAEAAFSEQLVFANLDGELTVFEDDICEDEAEHEQEEEGDEALPSENLEFATDINEEGEDKKRRITSLTSFSCKVEADLMSEYASVVDASYASQLVM